LITVYVASVWPRLLMIRVVGAFTYGQMYYLNVRMDLCFGNFDGRVETTFAAGHVQV
jgi:hypothetical protein